MLVECPSCAIEVLADGSGTCPRCGTFVKEPAPDEVYEITEESAGGEPSARHSELPGPHLGWAIFVVIVAASLSAVASVVAVFGVSAFYPQIFRDFDLIYSLSFAAGSLTMFAMAWIGLQPQPKGGMGLVSPSAAHLAIAVFLALPLQILVTGAQHRFENAWSDADLMGAAEVGSPFDHWYAYRALARQPWLAVFIIGCVMPALAEEAFFRGLLGRGLVARYRMLPGILLTSVLFGVVHYEPSHVASAFALGLVLHLVYLWSHSLWPPVALHLANNAIAFATLKSEEERWLPSTFFADFVSVPNMAASACTVVALLLLMGCTRRKWEAEESNLPARAFLTIEPPNSQTARLAARRTGVAVWLLAVVATGGFSLTMVRFAAYERGPFAAVAVLRDADAKYLDGDYERAARIYSSAIELSPRSVEGWHGRSLSRLNMGQHQLALNDAEESLLLNRDDSHALAVRASALASLRRSKEGLADAKRASHLAPDDVWTCSVLAHVAYEAGEYQLAETASLKGRRLDKSMAYFPTMLAQIYSWCPQQDLRNNYQAMLMAEEACELSYYADPHALLALAHVRLMDGEHTKAAALLDDAAAHSEGAVHAFASCQARHLREYGVQFIKLRASWKPVIVDDFMLYPASNHCVLVVAERQLLFAKKVVVDHPFPAEWKQTVMTLPQFEDKLHEFSEELAARAKVDREQSVAIAMTVALTAEDFLAIEDAVLAEELLWEVDEVKRVKACLQRAK